MREVEGETCLEFWLISVIFSYHDNLLQNKKIFCIIHTHNQYVKKQDHPENTAYFFKKLPNLWFFGPNFECDYLL
jgi:hypothetical protein